MNLGAHVSIAGSIDNAIDIGIRLGCDSIQIFPGPPRAWLEPNFGQVKLTNFCQERKKSSIKNVFIHAIYLVNLATSDPTLEEKSMKAMLFAGNLARQIKADGVIFHPGSARGGNRSQAVKKIAKNTATLIDKTGANFIFENTAGAGDTIGTTFEELSNLIALTDRPANTGICLDTCHLTASGYALEKTGDVDRLSTQVAEALPKNSIKVIHLNDSKYPAGQNRDVHNDIGTGTIPIKVFRLLTRHQTFLNLPFILETPALKDRLPELTGLNLEIIGEVNRVRTALSTK